MSGKYGDELADLMQQIIALLIENPKLNLKEVALKLDRDLVYLIYSLLIMEQENLIFINRPVVSG